MHSLFLTDYQLALNGFVEQLQLLINNYYTKNLSNLSPATVRVIPGLKYDKIIKIHDNGSRCVHSFIEKATGNILKAASFSTPAKGKRGNIYSETPLSGVDEYGAHYLKTH